MGIQSSIMGMHALFGDPICPIVIKGRLWMCWLMVRFNDNRRITHDHGDVRTHLSAVELCKQPGSDCGDWDEHDGNYENGHRGVLKPRGIIADGVINIHYLYWSLFQ